MEPCAAFARKVFPGGGVWAWRRFGGWLKDAKNQTFKDNPQCFFIFDPMFCFSNFKIFGDCWDFEVCFLVGQFGLAGLKLWKS